MVARNKPTQSKARRRGHRRGGLQIDLMVALAILVMAVIPLSHSVRHERQICRGQYYRAVAMSIVDGETEILKAGAWQSFDIGEQDYPITAEAITELPHGRFHLTRTKDTIKLEWIPDRDQNGGRVVREFELSTAP